MGKIKTLVFSDRDGTINEDGNYYLGSHPLWKDQVRILEGVIDGIKLINSIPNSYFYIISNQAGVALQGRRFKDLTEKRMSGVNNYIIKQLRRQGCKISGSYLCPYVTSEYAKQAFAKERIVNPKYIDNNNPNIKPGTGMIEKALEELKLKENYRIFVIGDRFSDMKVAINVGGIGILVESPKTIELGDLEKAAGINTIHLAKNFLNAAEFIKKQVERN